jgi:hypothetical protein
MAILLQSITSSAYGTKAIGKFKPERLRCAHVDDQLVPGPTTVIAGHIIAATRLCVKTITLEGRKSRAERLRRRLLIAWAVSRSS